VYVLKALQADTIVSILENALQDPRSPLGDTRVQVEGNMLEQIARVADGDARRALNLLEIASDLGRQPDGSVQISVQLAEQLFSGDVRRFDKGGDLFYEQISALHKAVRGSSPDGALYWLLRMLEGGCDPLYIARRLVRMASEDIGNADPRALAIALNAWDSVERLGSPEGELTLAQAVIYLASAAKSNAVYNAFKAMRELVRNGPDYEVPMHLRNAPTGLMKSMDYGEGYRYAHDEPGAYAAGESYLPQELTHQQFYQPVDRGLEKKIAEKLQYLRSLDLNSDQRRYAR
jgi:putative ATPase